MEETSSGPIIAGDASQGNAVVVPTSPLDRHRAEQVRLLRGRLAAVEAETEAKAGPIREAIAEAEAQGRDDQARLDALLRSRTLFCASAERLRAGLETEIVQVEARLAVLRQRREDERVAVQETMATFTTDAHALRNRIAPLDLRRAELTTSLEKIQARGEKLAAPLRRAIERKLAQMGGDLAEELRRTPRHDAVRAHMAEEVACLKDHPGIFVADAPITSDIGAGPEDFGGSDYPDLPLSGGGEVRS